MNFQTLLRLLLFIVLLAVLVILTSRALPPSVGTSDFIGYWAGARLLLHGEDPYNADSILRIQREAYPDRQHPMFTWNPPWLGVLLLPLAALPFQQATVAWLLINLFLVSVSSLGIWWLFDGPESVSRSWLALPVAFLFVQTLTTLDTGQITTFMLVGVTGFLIAIKLERWMLAGALLALTTVKPHLVLLWLPLVFLWTLERHRWRVWIGFGLVIAMWLAILTFFLPSWPSAYSAIIEAPPTNWATPTLGGLLTIIFRNSWARFLSLMFLPAVIILWRKTGECRLELVTAGLLPFCLALAIFGWSYDQVLLLVPIIAITVNLVRNELSLQDTWITVGLLSIFGIGLLAQRIRSTDEVYYLWVPCAVLLIGAWTVWRQKQNSVSSGERLTMKG